MVAHSVRDKCGLPSATRSLTDAVGGGESAVAAFCCMCEGFCCCGASTPSAFLCFLSEGSSSSPPSSLSSSSSSSPSSSSSLLRLQPLSNILHALAMSKTVRVSTGIAMPLMLPNDGCGDIDDDGDDDGDDDNQARPISMASGVTPCMWNRAPLAVEPNAAQNAFRSSREGDRRRLLSQPLEWRVVSFSSFSSSIVEVSGLP
mmetsp:Transcript_13714/g.28098  ORF Transcript_13714/g.28098 Transcript_13714/m.28098 type:complete len:202 (-) Transcript_13714:583-1188(-)